MHYVLWFICLVNGELYSAPLHQYENYSACWDAKELAKHDLEQEYPGDTMFLVCLDYSEV